MLISKENDKNGQLKKFLAFYKEENPDKLKRIINKKCENTLPLFKAIRVCRLESVELLIKCGADINLLARKMTSLQCAVKHKKPETLRLLLDQKPDLTTVEHALQNIPSKYITYKCVKMLKNYEKSFPIEDEQAETPEPPETPDVPETVTHFPSLLSPVSPTSTTYSSPPPPETKKRPHSRLDCTASVVSKQPKLSGCAFTVLSRQALDNLRQKATGQVPATLPTMSD
jgi:Ankyrin repeats (3 copies)